MNKIEKIKEDIYNYLYENGYYEDNEKLFYPVFGGKICIRYTYVANSEKGKHLKEIWTKQENIYDRYFLEYIGTILRKHKVKEIEVDNNTYSSTKWTFGTIKKK